MSELPDVAGTQRFAQLLQQSDARRGDADTHNATIIGGTVAVDEAALLQFIQHARDVGRARNQEGREIEGAKFVRMLAAQETKRVVLLRRQLVMLEQLVLQGAEAVV